MGGARSASTHRTKVLEDPKRKSESDPRLVRDDSQVSALAKATFWRVGSPGADRLQPAETVHLNRLSSVVSRRSASKHAIVTPCGSECVFDHSVYGLLNGMGLNWVVVVCGGATFPIAPIVEHLAIDGATTTPSRRLPCRPVTLVWAAQLFPRRWGSRAVNGVSALF